MPAEFVQGQGHDFSFRGMSSLETAVLSGMGHLLSFTGTDTIPAIDALEQYYKADADKELIGGSVAATEHSVMCSGSKDGELETFKRLVTEVYPSGIVSIVSDTWDLWKVCTEYLPALKSVILQRDGESNESFSKAPVLDADSNEEDDGQQILGFDPRTLPKTYGRYSRYPNEHHQQLMSIIDFEKENYEGNRTYTELTSVNMQRSDPPSENFQHDLFSFEKQMINSIPSRQLSPSSAAHSIFTNILQQHVPSSASSSNRIKRTRTEGKYGEEITSSNRLNELKEKVTTLNLKKRSIKSTKQTTSTSVLASGADLETTTRKKRKISKQHSEIITSAQATRAIATLETPSPSNEGSSQNNTSPSLQTQQQHSSNN
ncbi:unnamed protein product [Rotaria sp. Silwood2]|nr:unnamed protein product [Rotaria sp. Silwood2]